MQTTAGASRTEPQLMKAADVEARHKQHTCRCNVAWHGGNGRASPLDLPVTEPQPDRAACRRAATGEPALFPDDPPRAPNVAANPASAAGNGRNSALRSAPRTAARPSRQRQRAACIGACRGGRRRTATRAEPCTCRCSRKRRRRNVRCTRARRTPPMPARRPFQSASDRAIGRWPASTAGSDRSSSQPDAPDASARAVAAPCVSPMARAMRLQVAPRRRRAARARKAARLSTARCASGSMAISPRSSRRLTPRSIDDTPESRTGPARSYRPAVARRRPHAHRTGTPGSARTAAAARQDRAQRARPVAGIAERLLAVRVGWPPPSTGAPSRRARCRLLRLTLGWRRG